MNNSSIIVDALSMIFSVNRDVFFAVYTSIYTSVQALCISSLFAIPLALYISLKKKETVIEQYCIQMIRYVVDSLLAIPTVLLGLLGYILFSNAGFFSFAQLLYTTTGMSIILALLAFPLLTSLMTTILDDADPSILQTAYTLGASSFQGIKTLLWEKRNNIASAYITTLTRLLSEVGIAMMVGGNIKYHTRTITTAIALETGKGNFSLGIALGIILLLFSTTLTIGIRILQKKK